MTEPNESASPRPHKKNDGTVDFEKSHPYDKVHSHTEIIQCTECSKAQEATVYNTFPLASYVHTCTGCGYIIMESEWQKIELPIKTKLT